MGVMSVLNVTVEHGLVGVTIGSSIPCVQEKITATNSNNKNKGLFMV
jgi:hypothetical protein